jgi:hypothetical protein
MLRVVRLSVIDISAILEGTLADGVGGKGWLHMVGLCAKVENAIFETGTYFVKVAADIDAEIYKNMIKKTAYVFGNATAELALGDGNNSIDVADELESLQDSWSSLKELIDGNVDSITSRPVEEKRKLLKTVDAKKEQLLQNASDITMKYVHKSNENGGPKTVTTLMYAVKQIMGISSLTKDLILSSLDFDKRETISRTIADFNNRHTVLLEGNSLNGIPMMSDVCKLLLMRDVTYLWDKFSAGLTSVTDSAASTTMAARATTFIETGLADAETLLTEMKDVKALIIEDKNDCNPTKGISKEQWWILTQRTGLQRVLSQKSVRLFTNIATGVMVAENKVELVIALDQAKSNLDDLLFGNKKDDNVPSPISRDIAEGLAHSKYLWDQMSPDLRAVVTQETPDPTVLTKCSRLSDPLLVSLNGVMDFLVASAASNMPSLQATVIDISGAQLVKICKLCKEAMLATLEIDRDKNVLQMSDSVKLWRNAHTTLLRGGVPKTNTSSGVNETTNVCLLQQMQEALDVHRSLEEAAYILVKHGNNSAELHQLNLLAYAKMFDAVTMYGTIGDVTCELKKNSVDDFKSFLFAVGELRMLLQRVQNKFLSSAMELNTTINEISSSFEQLLFGETSIGIKAAPTQAIADALFDMEALWLQLKSALATSTAIVTQDSLSSKKSGVDAVMTSDKIEAIMEAYVTLTEEKVSGEELNARRVDIASRQRMFVERMAKEALLVRESSADDQQLRRTMDAYESAHAELMDQTHSGRDDVLQNLARAQATWVAYKTQLLDVASGSRMTEMQTQLDLLTSILEEIVRMYAQVVPAPVRRQRSSFLLVRVLIPLALVVGPTFLGFIRGFFSKREDCSK